MTFRGRHAIVTGGSSGIGLATVRMLVAEGARVSVIALDDDYLSAMAAAPPIGERRVHLIDADVADRSQVDGAIAACVAEHGPCDILITCAGIVLPGYFEDLAVGEFERENAVNYLGTLYAIKAVVHPMIERGRGSIVCISSAAGLLGVFGYSAYGPTKYAVRGLCEIIRNELKPHGIGVSCVYPSDVDTPQLAFEEPYKPAELRAVSGTIKPVPPEQVAAAILKGIRKGSPVIYPELQTRLVARVSGALPGFTRFYLDRVVARARRKRLRG
ncbi:MAG: SDR family oxidoreductase [Actinobacteria bacterium]|nr:SDR family oxidoreductase [Actinomycetota bacterium]MBU1493597.1 SDR family oxidoreductase [Actinomycetota bacterium]